MESAPAPSLTPQTSRPPRVAFLIGIPHYGYADLGPLPAIRGELADLASTLEGELAPEHRFQVHTHISDLKTPLTRARVEALFAEIGTHRYAREVLVLIAGHGIRDAQGGARFLPYGDANQEGMDLSALWEALGNLHRSACLVLLDFCHAQGLTPEHQLLREAQGAAPLAGPPALEGRDVALISAAKVDELAPAGSQAGGGPASLTALFTRGLMIAMSGRDGEITLDTLEFWLLRATRGTTRHRIQVQKRTLKVGDWVLNRVQMPPEDPLPGLVQEGILCDVKSFLELPFAHGREQVTMAETGLEDSPLWPRTLVGEVLDLLGDGGHALIIGPPMSGKTCIARQVASALVLHTAKIASRWPIPNALSELRTAIYYAPEPEHLSRLVTIIERDVPCLLIIDNLERDPRGAQDFMQRWQAMTEDVESPGLRLLLISQDAVILTERGERYNPFHMLTGKVSSGMSSAEYVDALAWCWMQQNPGKGRLTPPNFLRHRRSIYLIGFLPWAAEHLGPQPTRLNYWNHTFYEEVYSAYLSHAQGPTFRRETLTQLSILSWFAIPAHGDFFPLQEVNTLIDQGVVVRSGDGYVGLSLPPPDGRTRVWRTDRARILRTLLSYIALDRCNYLDVLTGIATRLDRERRAGGSGPDLLLAFIGGAEAHLRRFLAEERDHTRAALALDLLRAYGGPGVAQRVLGAHLGCEDDERTPDTLRDGLFEMLNSDERMDIPTLNRYLLALVSIDRRVLPERLYAPWETGSELVDLLRHLVLRANDHDAPAFMETLAKGSRELSRGLFEEMPLPDLMPNEGQTGGEDAEEGDSLTEHAPRGASSLSALRLSHLLTRFDPERRKEVIRALDPETVATMILAADRPRPVQRLIQAMSRISRRRTHQGLTAVIEGQAFRRWADALFRSGLDIYDVVHLLNEIARLSRRTAYDLVQRLQPYLLAIARQESRPHHVGELLGTLGKLSRDVAESVARGVDLPERLKETLEIEILPSRLAKSLTAAGRAAPALCEAFAAEEPERIREWLSRWLSRCRRLPDLCDVLQAFAYVLGPERMAVEAEALFHPPGGPPLTATRDFRDLLRESSRPEDLLRLTHILREDSPLPVNLQLEIRALLQGDRYIQGVKRSLRLQELARGIAALSHIWPERTRRETASWVAALDDGKAGLPMPLAQLRAHPEAPLPLQGLTEFFSNVQRVDFDLAERSLDLISGEPGENGRRLDKDIDRERHEDSKAQFIGAVSKIRRELGEALARRTFEKIDPMTLLQDNARISVFRETLRAFCRANPSRYAEWLRPHLEVEGAPLLKGIRAAIVEEVDIAEVGRLIDLIHRAHAPAAAALLAAVQEQIQWFTEAALYHCASVQVLNFMASIQLESLEASVDPITDQLVGMGIMERAGEVSSPWAVASALRYAHYLSERRREPRLMGIAWESLRHEPIAAAMEASSDLLAVGLLGAQSRILISEGYTQARILLEGSQGVALRRLDQLVSEPGPAVGSLRMVQDLSPLFLRAMVHPHMEDGQLTQIVQRLGAYPVGTQLWLCGVLNWLAGGVLGAGADLFLPASELGGLLIPLKSGGFCLQEAANAALKRLRGGPRALWGYVFVTQNRLRLPAEEQQWRHRFLHQYQKIESRQVQQRLARRLDLNDVQGVQEMATSFEDLTVLVTDLRGHL